MFSTLKKITGQTIVEYALLVGIVIALLLVVTPMIKRGAQGMVKVVADEVGYQNNAEQKDGHGLISTQVKTRLDKIQKKKEFYDGTKHSVYTHYDERVDTDTESKSDLGPAEK